MSENLNKEGINININNSDGESGGGGFTDRIFNLGLRVLLPLALIFVVGVLIIVVRLLIPLLDLAGDFFDGVLTFFPGTGASVIGAVIAGALGVIAGRR